ncbi:MAG: F0F1 ATP synthase subunit gamma [Thermoleophilia bacterium]
METLEGLGRRIATTEDLESIVKTMKSLSAVSIKQYEDSVASLKVYSHALELGFHVALQGFAHALPARSSHGSLAVIVFGSDHGLCGRFNEQIGDVAREHAHAGEDPPAKVHWLVVGGRAAARLEAAGERPEETLMLPGAPSGLVATSQAVIMIVDRWRREAGVERVLLVHNQRTEHATATPEVRQVLPLDPGWLRTLMTAPWPSRRLPTYSMAVDDLFATLVREYLFLSVYRAGAESLSSEHATRLLAMQAAERNIDETLDELSGMYRRMRQDSITEELLDVVAGFEVLETQD